MTLKGGSGSAGADDEAFGVLELAAVRFAAIRRVKEETSAPHMRLVCNHLQCLLLQGLRRKTNIFNQSNSTARAVNNKIRKIARQFESRPANAIL